MVQVELSPERNTVVTLEDGSKIIYNAGNLSWVMTSAALICLMAFGIGYLYSGLLRRKNALSQLFLACAAFAVVAVQWFLIGYSLSFSETGSPFIGNLRHFGMIGVLAEPAPLATTIPRITFALYHLMFAATTVVILVGACAERGRLGPVLFLAFVWPTLVYNPVAYWSWSVNGWAHKLGVLDFAGGGVVHMTSGTGAMAYAYWLGKREGYGTAQVAYRPNSVQNVVLGTVFLLVGWQGFNGGSALAADLRASMAGFVTMLAASAAGLTWCIMDLRFERKWSSVSFCTGVVTGLIAITPASGFVGAPSALGIGIISAVLSNFATALKFVARFDDTLDVFATHCVSGFIGNFLTGVFADNRIASLDGTIIQGGAINGNGKQILKQLAYSGAIFGWTFCVTSILLLLMDRFPGLTLRASAAAERDGIDITEMNEIAVDNSADMKLQLPTATYSPFAASQLVQSVNVQRPMSNPLIPDTASVRSFEQKRFA